jgi:hypothetical protein
MKYETTSVGGENLITVVLLYRRVEARAGEFDVAVKFLWFHVP